MAVSKNTRKSDSHTNKLFQSFFQNNRVSDERERVWHEAVRHAGTGTPPLRFAVYEPLIQYVRAAVCGDPLEPMTGIEHTDAWLFKGRRKIEGKNLRDPDEVYFLVRDRELERIEQGLPPRIQFPDDAAATH